MVKVLLTQTVKTGKMEEREMNQVGKIMEMLNHTLPEDYEYNFIDDHYDHEETFRMKLTTNSEMKKWLSELEQKSRTTWRVSRTFPDSGRVNVSRKHYRCHHNTDKRSSGAKRSKNTNCPANIKITVKRFVENSKARHVDPLIKEWPCVISFNNKHNHSLESASVLKHRVMSEETKQKLLDLFHQGHAPSSALKCLKTDLYLEHPEDYALYEGDGHYVPSLSICGHLYTKEFKQQYGGRSEAEIANDLKEFLEEYSTSTGGKALSRRTDDGHSYVCICTPLMTRAHIMIKQSSEVVHVDAVSSLGRQRHRVYFLTTSTPAGGLPLGIIISDTEKEAVFDRALTDLIESCLPEKSFYGQNYPTVIISDVDPKERIPLQSHFPGSSLLLCQFHVLKAMWSWLCKTTKNGNGIEKSDCQELYYLFKSVVYSRSEDELLMAFSQLICENEVAKKYPPFIMYVEKMWQEKETWASCYRFGLPLWGNSTTNYAEVAFRISKDSILEKVVSFNLAKLVDFFLTRYETYVEKQLVSFSQGRVQKSLLCVDGISEYESETRSDCFTVPEENVSYAVDISRCICECPHGNASSICKHISAVFQKLKQDSISIAGESTLLSRITLFQVATGKEPDREWLLGATPEVPPEKTLPQVQQAPEVETTSSRGNDMTYVELYVSPNDEKENSKKRPTLDRNPILQAKQKVKRFCDTVIQGLERNPNAFIPAITEMALNANKYASTEAGLVAALHTFAEYPRTHPPKKNRVAAVKQNKVKQNKVTSSRYRQIAPKPRINKQADHDYTM